jgi:hypothetical protein
MILRTKYRENQGELFHLQGRMTKFYSQFIEKILKLKQIYLIFYDFSRVRLQCGLNIFL